MSDTFELSPMRILPPQDFSQDVDFAIGVRHAWLKPPRELQDVTNPQFWTHVEGWLRRGDLVWCMAHDLSYCCLMVCRSPAPNLVMTPIELRYPEKRVDPEEYEVRWDQGASGYNILFNGKKVAESDTIRSRDEATLWIEAHRTARAVEEQRMKPKVTAKAKEPEPETAAA